MPAEVAVLTAIDGERADAKERGLALDQDLLTRAKAGDAEAFEALIVRYQRQVLGTALRLAGNPDDACDCAQEVFLRFYRYIHTLQAGRAISTWLYRVTVNVCCDLGKRRRNKREVSLEQKQAKDGFDPPAGQDVQEDFSLREERRILQAALSTLPKKARAAIVLRDFQGLETREVAKILGVSEVTVRSHISLARIRIKKYRDRDCGRQA